MKEVLLYDKLKNKNVRCSVCQRRCLISPNQLGFCQTRLNKNGQLCSLIYGIVVSPAIDPIEKKPLYHFRPGTQVFSISSYGCNFRCKQCLNFPTTYGATEQLKQLLHSNYIYNYSEPGEVIELAKKYNSPGIAFTYNEPTIWLEYILDVAGLAKQKTLRGGYKIFEDSLSPDVTSGRFETGKNFHGRPQQSHGFYTVFITNGSFTPESLALLAPYIDAMNIDFKGFSDKTYQKMGAYFGQIPEVTKLAIKKYGVHVEITTVLIPGINDDWEEIKKMCNWITENLGPKTPWHLSRFDPYLAPDPEFQKIRQTPMEELQRAEEIGEKEGLKFIYTWTASSEYYRTDTYCPKCKKLVIRRGLWQPEILGVEKKENRGYCKYCGEDLNLIL